MGMMGSGKCRSHKTKATRKSAAKTSITAVCHEAKAKVLPARDNQIRAADTAAVIRPVPRKSIRGLLICATGTFKKRHSTAIAAREKGIETQRHHRHPSQGVATINPPTRGPEILEMAMTAPIYPL